MIEKYKDLFISLENCSNCEFCSKKNNFHYCLAMRRDISIERLEDRKAVTPCLDEDSLRKEIPEEELYIFKNMYNIK